MMLRWCCRAPHYHPSSPWTADIRRDVSWLLHFLHALFPFSLVICGAPVSGRKMEKKKRRRQKRTKMKTIWWEVEAGRRKTMTEERKIPLSPWRLGWSVGRLGERGGRRRRPWPLPRLPPRLSQPPRSGAWRKSPPSSTRCQVNMSRCPTRRASPGTFNSEPSVWFTPHSVS